MALCFIKNIWESILIKYYRRLSLLLSLILSLTGCATSKLWSDENYDIYESTAVATGLEIYAENPLVLSKYDSPEVRIKYTGVKNAVDNNSLPPYHDGCIVLERFADSSGFLVGLESLLNATPKSKINSVKAVISHRSYDPAESYHLRLGLALQPVDNDLFDGIGKPKVNSSWSPILHGPPQGVAQKAQKYSKSRRYTPLDSFIIPDNSEKDTLYFLIGGPSGGGPSGITQLVFNKECVIKDNFIPLLQNDKIPFTIQFVEGEKAKEFPLSARIFGTPFTVAFDVITFPIQALLVVTIGSQIRY